MAKQTGKLLHSSLVTMMLCVVASCSRPAPMTNTIIDQVRAPDSSSSAVLVRRSRSAALSNDVFYVVVIPTGRNIQHVINEEDIRKSAVLVATLASKVKLSWPEGGPLHVLCNACGLEAIDIMTKQPQAGQHRVVYDGFPQHTAYD